MPLLPQSPCARCRHGYALHGNGSTPCQAGGCHAGPEDTRCPGFLVPSVPEALELAYPELGPQDMLQPVRVPAVTPEGTRQ